MSELILKDKRDIFIGLKDDAKPPGDLVCYDCVHAVSHWSSTQVVFFCKNLYKDIWQSGYEEPHRIGCSHKELPKVAKASTPSTPFPGEEFTEVQEDMSEPDFDMDELQEPEQENEGFFKNK